MTTTLDRKAFDDGLFLIAGPCVMESLTLLHTVAEKLHEIREKTGALIVFKSSYDKANRTSADGFRGPGIDKGLDWLNEIKRDYGFPIITDVHNEEQARIAGERVDIIQIPAFLCRQTDMIVAACETSAWVNIKKGQFLAPWEMEKVVEKAKRVSDRILLTERGSSFGYNMLVSDMRAIPIMAKNDCPIIYDATHSVQMPGGKGDSTGGDRRNVPPLSLAAVGAGANGLFWETHPNPDEAKSDGPNMLQLEDVGPLFEKCRRIHDIVQN